MEKRHRRSLLAESPSPGNKENNKKEEETTNVKQQKKEEAGKLYPDLFDGDEVNGKMMDADEHETTPQKRIYPEEAANNRSWPPTTSISSMEEQEEEDDENESDKESDDEKTGENEYNLRSGKRRTRRTDRRSLPIESVKNREKQESRSRSGRRLPRGTQSPEPKLGTETSKININLKTSNADSNWAWTQTPIELYQIMTFAIIIILAIMFMVYIVPFFMAFKQETPEQKFAAFRKDLRSLIDQESSAIDNNQRSYLERSLMYVADKMLRRNQQGNANNNGQNGPLTLLMASTNAENADRTAHKYTELLQQHWPSYRLNHTLRPEISRLELERQVLNPLLDKRADGHMVLLHLAGLDQLRTTAPLFLHSLADSESSPLLSTQHNVLIIGSMQLVDGSGDQQHVAGCSERIERSLLIKWKSEMLSEDQIQPILSRISALSVCLD